MRHYPCSCYVTKSILESPTEGLGLGRALGGLCAAAIYQLVRKDVIVLTSGLTVMDTHKHTPSHHAHLLPLRHPQVAGWPCLTLIFCSLKPGSWKGMWEAMTL